MITLPTDDSRTAIVGTTGSGKTIFSLWLLSLADFTERPWFIIDFKRDGSLALIDAVDVDINEPPPDYPDLYILRPMPGDEDKVSDYFRQLWQMGNCGIYIDEGYMVSKNDTWYRALLTQGRSKHIQMFILSQRPKWMDLFTFTEAQYFAIFDLNFQEDKKHVSNFLDGLEIGDLRRYHTLWYDVKNKDHAVFSPVPSPGDIAGRINSRLERYRTSEDTAKRPIPL